MGERFWSDDFDMDLPRIIPAVDEVLAAIEAPLWTYGGTSHGRLNHPSVWDAAYFGTDRAGAWKPESYYTSEPLVECTWREVVRDAWPHTYLVVVNGVPVWDTRRPLSGMFEKLMYDLRGWRALPRGEAAQLRGKVFASVIAATRDVERLISAVA